MSPTTASAASHHTVTLLLVLVLLLLLPVSIVMVLAPYRLLQCNHGHEHATHAVISAAIF